ncbi:hypothetical protein CONPUDRAFT_104467 [Coniophora puteana RWD-64-598 SS2]|uniref:T6SS Phospholipase effector Tle1-like catalytic domain-containing protein n=1 Tax=Coniophora puteana (strain RWD-64-598) TaxID=741705 RepID=A0A5M3MPW0_CONPW|nr:uncharacterized protein CONPUDRAFT_104467 [Coniophora puteana RWD-64-598 SS2]EIW81218.1 hypothetical protein CONPUDRAFT_104467 [Coniophora puteana RWD-64-598 SS2]
MSVSTADAGLPAYSTGKSRNLVLCFDGTAGQYDATNTNVVNFFSLLQKDSTEQLTYYQAGVGTYLQPGVVSPLLGWLGKVLDEAFAWYLDQHVMQGYSFLMDNYRPGDKIMLFGFSRGAYTARALAGMLEKVGLLPKSNEQQVSFAYKAYKDTRKNGIDLAQGFKETFSRSVSVEFVGVWDTVQSTGVLMSRSLPFTNSNQTVKTFRHALSLDEHRAKFRPNLYNIPISDTPTPSDDCQAQSRGKKLKEKSPGRRRFAIFSRKRNLEAKHVQITEEPQQIVREETIIEREGRHVTIETIATVEDYRQPMGEMHAWTTDVLEVWFAGCHSDVGGGNVGNDVKVSLAEITLRWMVEQVVMAQTGIRFDDEALLRNRITLPKFPVVTDQEMEVKSAEKQAKLHITERGVGLKVANNTGTKPDSNGASNGTTPAPSQSSPSQNPEDEPEFRSATSPLHDSLKEKPIWWLLEIIPLPFSWQSADGKWHKKWSIHLGKGRDIPNPNPNFHYTVKERMEYKPLNYKPKAIYNYGFENWV